MKANEHKILPSYIEKFAWLPKIINVTGSKGAIIWLQSYALRKHVNLPILCDCEAAPCSHNKFRKGYFKTLANCKTLGLLSIEYWR
jgi:hypothetical protein